VEDLTNGNAFSTQRSAFSPRNSFVLFQPASFPARLPKNKEARSQESGARRKPKPLIPRMQPVPNIKLLSYYQEFTKAIFAPFFRIQATQQLRAVSTGILPSKVAVSSSRIQGCYTISPCPIVYRHSSTSAVSFTARECL
jgi:hypothetical protein